MFRFALIDTDGTEHGPITFARADWKSGDVIPQGSGPNLRVVNVVWPEPGRQDLPLLVVEPDE
jgi:hypothetical protein